MIDHPARHENRLGQAENVGNLLPDRAAFLKIIVIPDNPMGQPRVGALESIESRQLTLQPDLIRYINDTYPDQFVTAAAFNPFKPMPLETNRLKQKLSAGARFVVTQPIVGENERVSQIGTLGIPLVVEAWMSKNIDLFYKSVGKEKDDYAEPFDPFENLKALHKFYPESCVYLSMLGFKQNWQDILPRLSKMNRK